MSDNELELLKTSGAAKDRLLKDGSSLDGRSTSKDGIEDDTSSLEVSRPRSCSIGVIPPGAKNSDTLNKTEAI